MRLAYDQGMIVFKTNFFDACYLFLEKKLVNVRNDYANGFRRALPEISGMGIMIIIQLNSFLSYGLDYLFAYGRMIIQRPGYI